MRRVDPIREKFFPVLVLHRPPHLIWRYGGSNIHRVELRLALARQQLNGRTGTDMHCFSGLRPRPALETRELPFLLTRVFATYSIRTKPVFAFLNVFHEEEEEEEEDVKKRVERSVRILLLHSR